LETDSESLLTILTATEIAGFQRLWELPADQDAPGLFARKWRQGVQLGRETGSSENIECCKTPFSEEL
jgi:hypothetical protein